MGTTSLKLPEDLKERVRLVAEARAMSPHAFLLESVRWATTAAEQRADFIAQARSAREHALNSDEVYDADDVHAHARTRAFGQDSPRPTAKRWRE